MTLKSLQLCRWTAIALCVLWSSTAVTAQVTTQPRGGYQRVNFTFSKSTRLTVNTTDHSIVLKFDTPLEKSPAQIAAMLKGYATGASLSADGKTLTLATDQRYRTRHFVSGNTVGLDIIGKGEAEKPSVATAAPVEKVEETDDDAAEPILTTKKRTPAPATNAPKLVKVEKTPKAAEKKIAGAKPQAPKAEPKKEAAKPQPAEKIAEAKAPEPSAVKADTEMLTTKKPEPASTPQPVPEPPQTVEAKPALKPETPKPTETKEPAKPLTAPPSQIEKAAGQAAAEKQAAPQVVEKIPQGPFMVTARTNSTGTVLNFPYSERTAAAVFERGNDIWILFSRAADANAARLQTVLPKTITAVKQYNYPGHTVLRLTGDGHVHASARSDKGGYGWDVTLAAAQLPVRDIAISVDTVEEKSRLMLGAFDVAEPVKFYDPLSGDLLMVLPSYEAGVGVSNARKFVEFTLLASNQGIAVATPRDDLTTRQSRLGVSLEAPKGLAVTKNLAILGASGAPMAGLSSGVMLPYELWRVPPDTFKAVLIERQHALARATKETRPEAMLALATLYLGQGMGSEALGYLDLLNANEPEFYKARKLALLTVAAHALQHHPEDAAQALAAPELADLEEAQLWREYLIMLAPKANAIQAILQGADKPVPVSENPAAPPPAAAAESEPKQDDAQEEQPQTANATPMLRFLKYNTHYIRFYPPRIRQLLASAAADGYIAGGVPEKAVTVFDTLTRDNILGPLQAQGEYALALEAVKNKKYPQAEELFKRIQAQKADPRMQARARVAHEMLQLSLGSKKPAEVAEALETIRLTWRGDTLERDVLKTLAGIYKDEKRYDAALRSYKTLSDEFPGDPDYINTSTAMTDLFEQLYVTGLADEMPPLTSLSLFYEFRDLTPIGPKGDLIIQKLADRLAAFDLLDRATQLLENQISFRVGGEERSRIGARLALLYLLNHQPQEALKVIEVTNFGANPPELQRQRMQLAAQALTGLTRYEEALNMLYYDPTPEGELLKLDILWAAQDWPNVTNKAEEILARRTDLTAPLTPSETEVLLKLALGYSFEGDYTQLRYLRDYYSGLMPESAYKPIFDYITNDTNPLDREDSALLGEQISRTEGFLNLFKEKIAAGKLSEAIK